MYESIQLTDTMPALGNSTSRSPSRPALIVTALILTSFVLSPTARAVEPEPDGGYPNDTTAEGENALLNLTTGFSNTAIGFDALVEHYRR